MLILLLNILNFILNMMFFDLQMAYLHQNIYVMDKEEDLLIILIHNRYTILYSYKTFILDLNYHNTLILDL